MSWLPSTIGLRRLPAPPVAPPLRPGARVPDVPSLPLPPHGRCLVAFIRHVGCPFAEAAVRQLRDWSELHPDTPVWVVSHGREDVTHRWLSCIGGAGGLHWVQDCDRHLYASWGLGESRFWHFAGPASLLGVMRLWPQGIRNRMASGTRWQRAGMFLVDSGHIVWCHVPRSAQELVLPPR